MKYIVLILLSLFCLNTFAQDNIDANGFVISSNGFKTEYVTLSEAPCDFVYDTSLKKNEAFISTSTSPCRVVCTSDGKTLVRANYVSGKYTYTIGFTDGTPSYCVFVPSGVTTIANNVLFIYSGITINKIYVFLPTSVKYIAPNAFPSNCDIYFYSGSSSSASNKFDLNGDGNVNVTDVGTEVNAVLNTGN